MTQSKPDEAADTISVNDMRDAMKDEIYEITKAAQLRIREISDLTAAYAAGELTPEQATEKFHIYHDRWGEALPGVPYAQNKTDEEILARINETCAGAFAARERAAKRKSQQRAATSTGSAEL